MGIISNIYQRKFPVTGLPFLFNLHVTKMDAVISFFIELSLHKKGHSRVYMAETSFIFFQKCRFSCVRVGDLLGHT